LIMAGAGWASWYVVGVRGLGFDRPGRGAVGLGCFPHYRKSHPVYSPLVFCLVAVLYMVCTWFIQSTCLGVVRGVVRVGSWRRVVCVPVVGGGEKGKNSGGGCDNERKSSTPHMSDLNRAALGNPTTEILVA